MSTVSSSNDYSALGLTCAATLSEIKARHRFLAMAFHPDRFPDSMKETATKELQRINNAYDRLSSSAPVDPALTSSQAAKHTQASPTQTSWRAQEPNKSDKAAKFSSFGEYEPVSAAVTASCAKCGGTILFGWRCMRARKGGAIYHNECLLEIMNAGATRASG